MSKHTYTIMRCKFNKYGEVVSKFHIGFEDARFTLEEAQTVLSKLMFPESNIIVKRKD